MLKKLKKAIKAADAAAEAAAWAAATSSPAWCIIGPLHCLDGPAVEYDEGRKYWYLSDQRHIGGPDMRRGLPADDVAVAATKAAADADAARAARADVARHEVRRILEQMLKKYA